MLKIINFWCDLSRTGRWACWLTVVLLVAVLSLFLSRKATVFPSPTNTKAQWRNLMALRKQTGAVDVSLIKPFSATDFQTPDIQLLHWLPDEKGGELALESDWKEIPGLFAKLAESGMSVSAFSILPTTSALLITLQLEAQHED